MIVFFVSALLDLSIGDILSKYHPVTYIGKITKIKTLFFKYNLTSKLSGTLYYLTVTLFILIPFISIYYILNATISQIGTIVYATFTLYFCIAGKSMLQHVRPIMQALLKGELKVAQRELSKIVARRTNVLKEKKIIQASIESLSEGFIDGFLSPVFWFLVGFTIDYTFNLLLFTFPHLLFASSLTLLYRITNTLDSTVGYRYHPYSTFGTSSAKIDDYLNYIPARLAVLILILPCFLSKNKVKLALKTYMRDRYKHPSPNAAHTQSFFAGALQIQLGGKTEYPNITIEKPTLGISIQNISINHLKQAIKLFNYSMIITYIYILLITAIIYLLSKL